MTATNSTPETTAAPAQVAEFSNSLAGSQQLQAGAFQQMARAQQEVQAEFLMARSFPRDETRCFGQLKQSCGRPQFAGKTAYKFPRGGTEIRGPSVHLAREAARIWGHISYGISIVGTSAKEIHIQGWARDSQTGTRVVSEARFGKLIFRKDRGWIEPDERDLRELVNRHGAVAERNAILKLLPPDLIDMALEESARTAKTGAASELKKNPRGVAAMVADSFLRFGVQTSQLKQWLDGRELHEMTDDEL
ncbi:MAG TPA: hypothetical protein VFB71_12635, partial [Ramlibacter sp.]|nr:hypothetical protein [Ramlibacter sp.]